MRKIETEAELEEKRKKRGRYLTALMLIILLGSTAGYAFLANPKEKSNSAGQENADELGVKIGENYIYLMNSRNKTADVPVEIAFGLEDYQEKKIYVVSENDAVNYEIASSLGRYSGMIQEACYGNCTQNLPEKNCNDMLIVWRESKENKVYQEDNCIFIEGDMRAVDAFIYKIFG